MTRRCPPLMLLLGFLLIAPAAGAADPQEAPPPALEGVGLWAGHYRHAGGVAEQVALEQLVDDMANGFNVLLRPIARRRLEKTVVVPERIEIGAGSTRLSVQAVGAPDLPDTAVFEDGAIVVRQSNFEGSRETTFHLDEAGRTLTMRVTTTSALLPEQLRYELTFERVVPGFAAGDAAPVAAPPPAVPTAGPALEAPGTGREGS